MKKTLKQIALGTVLAGALAFSAYRGVESLAQDKNIETSNTNSVVNTATNNIPDVSGRWYREGSGITKDGWCWSWANMWLKQDGTNISGKYKIEYYDSQPVTGSIESNRMRLTYAHMSTKEPMHLIGEVSNEFFIAGVFYGNPEKEWSQSRFTRVTNEDLPLMDAFNKFGTKERIEKKQEESKSEEK